MLYCCKMLMSRSRQKYKWVFNKKKAKAFQHFEVDIGPENWFNFSYQDGSMNIVHVVICKKGISYSVQKIHQYNVGYTSGWIHEHCTNVVISILS